MPELTLVSAGGSGLCVSFGVSLILTGYCVNIIKNKARIIHIIGVGLYISHV